MSGEGGQTTGNLRGKRLCALLSGGKDSNYALYRALQEGAVPVCILSVRPPSPESWMFHYPSVELVRLQARAMGLEEILHEYRVSGIKEKEVEELRVILERVHAEMKFEVISVGALASRYQEERIRRISRELGVEVYAPAWQADPEEYMRTLAREGFRFIIVRIATMGLPPSLLGVPVGPREVEEIIVLSRRYGFHPAFEGGEAETIVVDAPHYKARLIVEGEKVRLGPYEWEYRVRRAGLVWKASLGAARS